jgi:hypothetical protein
MIYSRTYNSFTHGRIPLSMGAKQLMQHLRNAISTAIADNQYSASDNAVARARGELAKYISGLEDTNEAARLTMLTLRNELDAATHSGARERYAYHGSSETRTWHGGPGGLQNLARFKYAKLAYAVGAGWISDTVPYAMPLCAVRESWPMYKPQSRIIGMFCDGRVS